MTVYLFEYDFRAIDGCSEDRSVLENYVLASKQELAYGIIASKQEMIKKLSLREMQEYYDQHSDKPRQFANVEDAAEMCWEMVVAGSTGYKVIKPNGSLKPLRASEAPQATVKPSKPSKKQGEAKVLPAAVEAAAGAAKPRLPTTKQFATMSFAAAGKPARSGTPMATILATIEDALGVATYQELYDALMAENPDAKLAARNIRRAFKFNVIKEETL